MKDHLQMIHLRERRKRTKVPRGPRLLWRVFAIVAACLPLAVGVALILWGGR